MTITLTGGRDVTAERERIEAMESAVAEELADAAAAVVVAQAHQAAIERLAQIAYAVIACAKFMDADRETTETTGCTD